MHKSVFAALAAATLATGAFAADAPARKAAAPVAALPAMPIFDIAFGGAVMSDYNFRGISQSDRGPAVGAYIEPRLKLIPEIELYAGIGALSLRLPTAPTAEVDLYGGIRPSLGPLSFDIGAIYYWYPGESQVFVLPTAGPVGLGVPTTQPGPLHLPWTKADTDFWEAYAKVAWTATDWLTLGGFVHYAPNWLNTGASGTYVGGNLKLTAPATFLPAEIGLYVSAEIARYMLGTTDAFFGSIDLPDYTYWNAGLGVTYKAITLDLRYHDTDAGEARCFTLTGDLNGLDTGARPGRSRWCGAAFIAKLSFDTTLAALR